MSKKILSLLLIVSCSFCFIKSVNAFSLNKIIESKYEYQEDFGGSSYNKEENNIQNNEMCNSYFGDPKVEGQPAYYMQLCFNIIKYVAIVALLVFVILDFLKALVASDKDALKKAGINAAKRFVFCVIIFFLPVLVNFLMTVLGAYGTCGIG